MIAQLTYENRGDTDLGKIRRYKRTMETFVSTMMIW